MRIERFESGQSGPGDVQELVPTKVLGIGRNYRAHAAEMGSDVPDEPLIFLMPPSAVIGHGAAIVRPRGDHRIDFEGELGVVIGARGRNVRAADAGSIIAGYTCVNDVTNRDLQKRDDQWARAKGTDTFCAIGPRIVAGLDPSDLAIRSRVNGELRQDARTSQLIFDVPTLIEVITRAMTLEPGDVIATGTPAGVGPIHAGDVVEIEIEGIGVLRNTVEDETS